jgi:hypothetical protein
MLWSEFPVSEDTLKLTLIFGCTLILPAVALAADVTPFGAKPGLWEATMTTEVAGRSMAAIPQIPPETLKRLPAEQREKIEAMMKSQGSGGGITTKVCITKESLNSGKFAQADSACTTKIVTSTSSKMVAHVECNHSGTQTAGDMTMELLSPTHFKGSMVTKTNVAGQTTEAKVGFDEKWISDDCGSVKPPVPK